MKKNYYESPICISSSEDESLSCGQCWSSLWSDDETLPDITPAKKRVKREPGSGDDAQRRNQQVRRGLPFTQQVGVVAGRPQGPEVRRNRARPLVRVPQDTEDSETSSLGADAWMQDCGMALLDTPRNDRRVTQASDRVAHNQGHGLGREAAGNSGRGRGCDHPRG